MDYYWLLPLSIPLCILIYLGCALPDWKKWKAAHWFGFLASVLTFTSVAVVDQSFEHGWAAATDMIIGIPLLCMLPLLIGLASRNFKALINPRPGPELVSLWLALIALVVLAATPNRQRMPNKLPPISNTELKQEFKNARKAYVAGEYDDCIRHLNDLNASLAYENSRELRSFCEQGKELTKRHRSYEPQNKRVPAAAE